MMFSVFFDLHFWVLFGQIYLKATCRILLPSLAVTKKTMQEKMFSYLEEVMEEF